MEDNKFQEIKSKYVSPEDIEHNQHSAHFVLSTFFNKRQFHIKDKLNNLQKYTLSDEEQFMVDNFMISSKVWETVLIYDHYGDTYGQNATLVFSAGKDCKVEVNRIEGYTIDEDYINVSIKGKNIKISEQASPSEVFKATVLYNYALEQLNKMPVSKAKDSPYLKLKVKIEEYFNRVSLSNKNKSYNKNYNLDLDVKNYLTDTEYADLIERTKAQALVDTLIEKNIIPKESATRKYPQNYELLDVKILPKVINRYNKLKERKQNQENLKNKIKGTVKNINKYIKLKLANIKNKQQTKQEIKKSVREMNFDR